MNYFIRFLLFALINFGGLAIGNLFTGPGVASTWYQQLDKAPWTPPGIVFGIAWFSIMLCFSFYMTNLWKMKQLGRRNGVLYAAEVVLNIGWNYVFFFLHADMAALLVIIALFCIVLYFLFVGFRSSALQGWLMVPYALWLCIAISLNAYITLFN
jgi:translocator protein